MSKSTIIKGKTASGLSFTIDSRVKDDTRLLLYLTRANNEDAPSMDRINATMSLLGLIFGDNLEIFLNEVAKRHNGVADATSLKEELSEILDALNVKN